MNGYYERAAAYCYNQAGLAEQGQRSPRHAPCGHASLRYEPTDDVYTCGDGCDLRLPGYLLASIWQQRGMYRYDRRGNDLADRCQTLEDENRTLLTENATLRQRVEKLERRR